MLEQPSKVIACLWHDGSLNVSDVAFAREIAPLPPPPLISTIQLFKENPGPGLSWPVSPEVSRLYFELFSTIPETTRPVETQHKRPEATPHTVTVAARA